MSTDPWDDARANEHVALAGLALEIGVNLQYGQDLIVTAPIEAGPLTRAIARGAYQRGAGLVTCLHDDPIALADRFWHADDASFDRAPDWLHDGIATALANGAARLYIAAPYPDLLSGVSAERVVRAHTAAAVAARAETELTSATRTNWSTIPFVTESWARTVFPDLPREDAARRLWASVDTVLRLGLEDPVAAWRRHTRALDERRDLLQQRGFTALRFHDGRTDLEVGLAGGHRWLGGTVLAANGVACVCNIPTEEVFTCPHKDRVDGEVYLSKPLWLAGARVTDVRLEFRDGCVTALHAGEGRDVLEKLIASDAGSRRLGEIALVPHSSPVSTSGVLFQSALFDENAATHFALGRAYTSSITDGIARDEVGANQSSVHLDCMFGNATMNVDGISRTGSVEPVMRDGEFVLGGLTDRQSITLGHVQ